MTTATFVSISCQACGLTSTVPVDALLISVAIHDPREPEHDPSEALADDTAGTVAWTCDSCADLVTAKLDWIALLTLVTAGATVLDDATDAPLPPHPEHSTGGTRLTRDDLLALHELLASNTWFDEVIDLDRANP